MRLTQDREWLMKMADAEDRYGCLVGVMPCDQTVFEDGRGDCLRASVATILRIPVSEVPNFAECGYFDGLRQWLDERGMEIIQVRFMDQEHCSGAWFDYPKRPVIMWGDSPRFKADGSRRKQHAVVGLAGGYGCEVIHDPHPSRDGLHSCYGVMWIVPKQQNTPGGAA